MLMLAAGLGLATTTAWVSVAAPAQATVATTTEYRVKAAFLHNFAQFTEWPGQAFADAGAPLVIGVLGADPFGSVFDELVQGETVAGLTLGSKLLRPAVIIIPGKD